MALRAEAERSGSISQIDVTPMADVMIVLLIIFMVAAPLVATDGVSLPAASHAGSDTGPLSVTIHGDGSLQLGERRMTDLGELLLGLSVRLHARTAGDRGVSVRADRGLRYGRVGEVVDVCREAGAEQVGLVALVAEGR